MKLEEKSKFLLRYGIIISDNECYDIRVRTIEYGDIKYIHVMKDGKCTYIAPMKL